MTDTKTYVFPESGTAGNSIDPNLLLAMNNGGGFGGNGNWMWIIFLFFLYGWNGNGFLGNNGGFSNQLNNDYGRSLLMDAISGNANAISNLANNLNFSTNQIQSAINAVQNGITSVGNTVGLTGQQVINAINSGNASISREFCECCCNMRQLVTEANYQNQIANLNQTNVLSSKLDANANTIAAKIDAQTVAMNDHFCQAEMRDMQTEINRLRDERTSLRSQLNINEQTAAIQALLIPVNTALATLQTEVANIKANTTPATANA